MAFKLGDIIIDRIQYGVAEDFSGNLLYVLTQLQDASIEISAESTDATDAQGTLVKRFWKGKTGTFSATNAMINLNVVGAASGTAPVIASASKKIVMPKIMTVKAGAPAVSLGSLVTGTVKVNALENNGSMGQAYAQATVASNTEFGLTSGGMFTPPTDPAVTQYIVKFDREVEEGGAIYNKADEFPGTVKLTLKALCVDPCSADTLKACYIVLPSFQVSPEVSLELSTEATIDYTGDLQVD